MITKLRLVKTSNISCGYSCLCVVRTFKSYLHSNFQRYYTVLLNIATMLYMTPPELTYFIIGSLYLLTTFTHFYHPTCPIQGNQLSSLCFYKFGLFFQISHISEIIVFVFLCFILHSILSPRFIYVVADGGIALLLWLIYIPLWVYTKTSLFIHLLISTQIVSMPQLLLIMLQ